jgi:hypothetical protein
MPFLNLDRGWSNLAQYYNQNFNNKPKVPSVKYTSFDDGLIRGGVVNAGIASVRDTARIGKFFLSGKGILFAAKQVGLQLTNPKLEQIVTYDNNIKDLVENTPFLSNKNTRLYNLGINTLAQIPLNAFGGHVVRHGSLPHGSGGGYNYEAITKENNKNSKQPLAPIEKYQAPAQSNQTNSSTYSDVDITAKKGEGFKNAIPTSDEPVIQPGGSKFINSTTGKILAKEEKEVVIKAPSKLKIEKYPNRLIQHLASIQKVKDPATKETKVNALILSPITLLEYNGGPGSVYGIGKTSIKTVPDQRTNVSTKEDDPKKPLLNGFNPKPYGFFDSRKNVQRNEMKHITPENGLNIEDRVGVSMVGEEIRSIDGINTISIMSWDKFQKMAVSSVTSNGTLSSDPDYFTYTSGSINRADKGNFGRDIIKFRLEFLDNDTNVPTVLVFRAYINDFNDGLNARWNSYRYMGRGEEFYVYDGFTRDISVSFTIYAHSPEEMAPLYQKLNYLMSTFTPDYSAYNKMRGNIGYLTVGDYIYRQPGIFTDIKLSGMLDTHWEIAFDDEFNGNSNQYEVPKHIKVNLSFKPIHDFLPRKVKLDKLDDTPFVTRNNAYNQNKINRYLTKPNAASPSGKDQDRNKQSSNLKQ